MATEDKAANKVTEIKGKAKKETGQAIGNEQMEAEGRADQAKGNLKQAGEKVKDAFKKKPAIESPDPSIRRKQARVGRPTRAFPCPAPAPPSRRVRRCSVP